MIAVDSGLGYLVIDSRNSGKRYDLVVAAMLVIGLIGLVLDLGFRSLEKIRSVRWGFPHESLRQECIRCFRMAAADHRAACLAERELGGCSE